VGAGGTTAAAKVTVEQTAPQALLRWKTFDVGEKTELHFDQRAGGASARQWTAFNQVQDPRGVPSQILGKLTADGQVYVINANGILFGAGSQVNLPSLVASSLPINKNLVANGLLNNPDSQFLFSGLPIELGVNGTPAFAPDPEMVPNGWFGDVRVERGARLSTPASADKVGGRIALIGANVTNEGWIATPEGQTILAAGLQVGFGAHAASDPSLRGLDVYVGDVGVAGGLQPRAGTVRNSGLVEVVRGGVVMAGRDVMQSGSIESSTSVALNGRVDLIAGYGAVANPQTFAAANGAGPQLPFLLRSAGTVELGGGSMIRIVPELASAEAVAGTRLALDSSVNIRGRVIHLGADSGILAPSAQVVVEAGEWRYQSGILPVSPFLNTVGQIYMDRGAWIDVAGTAGVEIPVSRNVVSVELRGTELADSPFQRNGVLRGKTIQVDMRNVGQWQGKSWVGTPLADASGYVGLIQRRVGELTTAGGSVVLRAGGSVVMQPGSSVDVSGGWLTYTGGVVETTKLLSSGRVLDIAQATPDIVYDGIYGETTTVRFDKYGVVETFPHPISKTAGAFEPGYYQGAAGGGLTIVAPSVALDGALVGTTLNGRLQRAEPAQPGTLRIDFTRRDGVAPLFIVESPTPPEVRFVTVQAQAPVDAFRLDEQGHELGLPDDRRLLVSMPVNWMGKSGFGAVSVYNPDGDIVVPAGIKLGINDFGRMTLDGANVRVLGRIEGPSAEVHLRARSVSPSALERLMSSAEGAVTPRPGEGRGLVEVGADARVAVAGSVVDDRAGATLGDPALLSLAGGMLSLDGLDVRISSGSVLDVSGGAQVTPTGRVVYGRGGSLAVAGGRAGSTGENPVLAGVLGGGVSLGGEMRGYGGERGGALSLTVPRVVIGAAGEGAGAIELSPEFFRMGGFSDYSVSAVGEVGKMGPTMQVAAGTMVKTGAESRRLDLTRAEPSWRLVLQPEGARRAGTVELHADGSYDAFTRLPVVRGDLVIGEGAMIQVEPSGSVRLVGDTVTVLGSVEALGGEISLRGGRDSNVAFPDKAGEFSKPLPTVVFGSAASLTVAGTRVLVPDAHGYRRGEVLSGGRLSVSGNIVAAAGSRFDASGASGELDLAISLGAGFRGGDARQSALTRFVPTLVESDGGTITFNGSQMLLMDGTVRAVAGGLSARGGTLNLASGHYFGVGVAANPTALDVTLEVSQTGGRVFGLAEGLAGAVMVDGSGLPLSTYAGVSVDRFAGGGLDVIRIDGTVSMIGDVSLNAGREIVLASGGVLYAGGRVQIDAPHVVLGTAFRTPFGISEDRTPFYQGTAPFRFGAKYGSGSLEVKGRLVDIGNLSLQGIGRVDILAESGDVRGNGTFDMRGALSLRAGQVYPPTSTQFVIGVGDYETEGGIQPGSIDVLAGGVRPAPWSAGGELGLYASRIVHRGVLVAPFGRITVGWDGVGDAPKNLLSGVPYGPTAVLEVGAGSRLSVSGVDSTGAVLQIPYGIVTGARQWVDPSGIDISAQGMPWKQVTLAAVDVRVDSGAALDIRGGGDVVGYRWISGVGGTKDVLASTNTYAIVPNYGLEYAPYAPFTQDRSADLLAGDVGYVSAALKVGDSLVLEGGDGFKGGRYTLLPARYAVMPGAFLVEPRAGVPDLVGKQIDGTFVMRGYPENVLSSGARAPSLTSGYTVTSRMGVLTRADYEVAGASEFVTQRTSELGLGEVRGPADAGQLKLLAKSGLGFSGNIDARALGAGRGGYVDFGVGGDVVLAGSREASSYSAGVLASGTFESFGAESVLIGGSRSFVKGGVVVDVRSQSLTVDNQSAPLRGNDVILAAKDRLSILVGAAVLQTGSGAGDGMDLRLGDPSIEGSGRGVMLRIGAAGDGRLVRQGGSGSDAAQLTIAEGTRLEGERVMINSTGGAFLSPLAGIKAGVFEVEAERVVLRLDDSVATPEGSGLVLSRSVLDGLAGSRRVSLRSLSSLELVGSGQFSFAGDVVIGAAAIQGYGQKGTGVELSALSFSLEGTPRVDAAPSAGGVGALSLRGSSVRHAGGAMLINDFQSTEIRSEAGFVFEQTGSLSAAGSLALWVPWLGASSGISGKLSAGGVLSIEPAAGSLQQGGVKGFGGSMELVGGSVTLKSGVKIPGGSLGITAVDGDIVLGGRIDMTGVRVPLRDVDRYVDGGRLRAQSSRGNILLLPESVLDVSAVAEGGEAGLVQLFAPGGRVEFGGTLVGRGGAGGSFELDQQSTPSTGMARLGETLKDGGFLRSHVFRFRTGDVFVDGMFDAREFRLAADIGSISVTGAIGSHGETGGRISLTAFGDITIGESALLDVSAKRFDAAGKGGSIRLEAGAQNSGFVNQGALLRMDGGRLDLGVEESVGVRADRFQGVLNLRAPVSADGLDVQVSRIASRIEGASLVSIEGYRLYALEGLDGVLDAGIQARAKADAESWLGIAGGVSGGYPTMLQRVTGGDATLMGRVVFRPGVEVINKEGGIRFASDWDLSGARFGPLSVPGNLMIRAVGDLSLESGGLSDGFASSAYNAQMQAMNLLLPANVQSWSYRLVAGAEMTSVDGLRTAENVTGSLLLGKDGGANVALRPSTGPLATASSALTGRFQVIRTGSGDIDVSVAGDVRFLNPFAAIYTAGARLADPTRVLVEGDFDVPVPKVLGTQGTLGAVQGLAVAQYAFSGGDVQIRAGRDIVRMTRNTSGELISDSSRQLPMNWLYRRGYVDSASGQFGLGDAGDVSSTTWWVDPTNFFQSIGALGGGSVRLEAGRDVMNVDAVLPTNARMAKGVPSNERMVEYGGGDLVVRAGRDVSGGVFYVEKGRGLITASGTVTTNSARSVSLTNLRPGDPGESELSWMPTTLFVGKSRFDVVANGDVLLGPVANPFLLPAGIGNTFWYKTYFSTYSETAGLDVVSLGGDVTLRRNVTFGSETGAQPLLQAWMEKQLLLSGASVPSASYFQPWLRLSESQVTPFRTVSGLMPPSLKVSAFGGDLNLVGDVTLAPSSVGGLEFAAGGSINGLQPNGVSSQLVPGSSQVAWAGSVINVSDAAPGLIPSVLMPYAYRALVGDGKTANVTTENLFLSAVDRLFAETGATAGAADSLQVKQALHASGLLHFGDADPVRMYALGGDISGLTLFAPKSARVQAERDLTDFSLYGQNMGVSDRTVVGAGRDVVLFNPSSAWRVQSRATGNILNFGQAPMEGDLQLGGSGTLEVVAGRDFRLGIGPTSEQGTGLGVTTIGNQRNPYLPVEGARIVLAAGIPGGGLDMGLDLGGFLDGLGDVRLGDVLKQIGATEIGGVRPVTAELLAQMGATERRLFGLGVLFRLLRDSGRASADARYREGTAAVEKIFGGVSRSGDVTLTSRGVKTRSGGDVSILAPHGDVTVGVELSSNSAQDQGVLTEAGGNISIFVNGSVNVGTSRIFTLRGGSEVIWASTGNIAAGASSKTVQAAPPTRVVIDTQTGSVKTDLAGLATGGGIGVLTSVAGIAPGDIDLIAPRGFVDAGDAGIRVSGNLNIAAVQVLNSTNIQVTGASAGVPAAPVSVSVSAGAMSVASSTTGATAGIGGESTKQAKPAVPQDEVLSIISVEVVGYGGGDANPDDEKKKRERP
jgi:filamentous hemagglutinin family protein